MPDEGAPKKERICFGDEVRFLSTAPDQLFPPFSRDEVYIAGRVKGSKVDLASPVGPIPIAMRYLEKVGGSSTEH